LIISIILFALLGWLVGIAINHAADVLPTRKTLFQGPRCSECGHKHPVTAWSALLALVGNHRACHQCGHSRPAFSRAVMVELITPALFIILLWQTGFSYRLGAVLLYTAILILITVTDLEHRLILNIVILPSIVVAIIFSFFSPLSGFWHFGDGCNSLLYGIYTLLLRAPSTFWEVAFIGGALGFVISFCAWLFAVLLYGHGALGQGDVTLSAFLGLIVGFPYILLTFLFTVLLGGIVPLLLILVRRVNRRSYIPYGPFLTISGWLMLTWGNEIWHFYFC
jgi:prepilin signal peptidase PulO-like enzyme (type II secretory pathway)